MAVKLYRYSENIPSFIDELLDEGDEVTYTEVIIKCTEDIMHVICSEDRAWLHPHANTSTTSISLNEGCLSFVKKEEKMGHNVKTLHRRYIIPYSSIVQIIVA